MWFKKILIYIVIFFMKVAFSVPDTSGDREWFFDKVSINNLFNENSRDTFDYLNQKFKQTKIVIKEGVLTIDNYLYDDFRICSVEYHRRRKTLLEYFFSQKTLDLYQDLMKTEGNLLSDNIYVISASDYDEECLAPYEELIEDNEFLWIVSDDYVIFFKENLTRGSAVIAFDSFCENINLGSSYDGIAEYQCDFPNKSIEMVYSIIKKHISDEDLEMKDDLPNKDLIYAPLNSQGIVSYTWLSDNRLQIFIDKSRGNEITNYILEAVDNGTKLIMKFETLY